MSGLPVRPARALRSMPFGSPGARRFARPAPEGAGEGAGLRIAQGRRDLRERHVAVLQQLAGNLEADLVRQCPVADAALQAAAQGAAVNGEQVGDVLRRTAMA